MKRNININFLVLVLAFLALSVLFAQTDTITLDNKSIFKNKQRTPVFFPHKKHMEGVDCRDCHHSYENGKNVLKVSDLKEGDPMVKCSSCHREKTEMGRYNLMDAFHVQCIECHRKTNKEGQKSGPMMCGQCHPK